MEAREEYIGPSLVFVPLRGTKGRAQDDKLDAVAVMVNFIATLGL